MQVVPGEASGRDRLILTVELALHTLYVRAEY
jgi:hypothetical protein